MDITAVEDYSKTVPNVAYVDNYKYMCSMPGQSVINKAIADNKLTGVVVAHVRHVSTNQRPGRQPGRWPQPINPRRQTPRAELVGTHA